MLPAAMPGHIAWLVLLRGFAGHATSTGEAETCDDQAELQLLQAGLKLAASAWVKPLGRSFYSEDPAMSEAWWVRYSTASHIPLDDEDLSSVGWLQSEQRSAVDVKTSGGLEAERLYFMKVPDWKSSQNLSMNNFIAASRASWASVIERKQIYSPWVDFHDGHAYIDLMWDRLARDNAHFQHYRHVTRAYIPNTTWTMEWLHSDGGLSSSLYAGAIAYPDPDLCRNHTHAANPWPKRLHWKATFGVLNASAASEVAVAVLGASPIPDPYPWPRQPGCIAVRWLSLPHTADFNLHFVENPVYKPVLHGIPEFFQYQREFLANHTGCINSFMLNNLILETPSLDPFAQRLDRLSIKYFVFNLPGDKYALLFSFPGNEGVTLQLQSQHVSHVEPQPVRICA
mmetsp:Transcript_40970/g.91628  ORF Transcript_40970/g.91628 Transcript_40970/m.91628 type:complete len:398 (+) Transcript_40970:79-1272(+)